MSDMTRAEAIAVLGKHENCSHGECDIWKECEICDNHTTDEEYETAFKMAINSLKVDEMYDLAMQSAEPLITRDNVLYAINACGCLYHQGKTWYEEEELIQCFDDLYFNDSKAEDEG